MPEFDKSMVDKVYDGDDKESVKHAKRRYRGLKMNRFLYHTIADFAIGNGEFLKAQLIFEQLKGYDPIRVKFWEWKKNMVKRLMKD